MTISELYKIFLVHSSVTTDTRKIKKGDLFFALKGPNFNGNRYVQAALTQGAAYCICDEETGVKDDRIIRTENALATQQQLAKYHRQRFNVPFIAITGSNGKTTTKELVHAVLSTKYRCYTTHGNFNNHIGIPLTLLSIKTDAEIAVVEMGANHRQEIKEYCIYSLPTHGLITNCGKAHLEGFGSEEGVRKGKGELYEHIGATNGTIFINTDYSYLEEMSRRVKNKISYGEKAADFMGTVKSADPFLDVEITKGANISSLKTQLAGSYNLPNILSAVCIGKTFDVPDHQIKQALEEYVPSNSRSQLIKKGSNTILLDAYNANPGSMKAAIENFVAMSGEKKAVMLGGMMELGNDSITEHKSLVDLLKQHPWYKVALTGKDFTGLPDNFYYFNSSEEMGEWYRRQKFENTLILVKGSRSMAMEKILE